jgi:hypothetical protein
MEITDDMAPLERYTIVHDVRMRDSPATFSIAYEFAIDPTFGQAQQPPATASRAHAVNKAFFYILNTY